ncbi:hypothetical protein BV898_08516 [Hypsibius exemplaris]|uniref:Metalloendopeptidase n=1 Tax=Hypsibius exemplaris TaxID=2072580 RepID=A0A1W0WQI3_HYPEX|nr:hypothetical protein BV898_08516 [Hypsibius exemplaris]
MTFGQEYDFASVMHFGKYDFAIDKTVWTIRPKKTYDSNFIGQRVGLSPTDIRKINLMYNCEDIDPDSKLETISTPTTVARISKASDGKERLCFSESYFGQCDGDDEACVQSCKDDKLSGGKCGAFKSSRVCYCEGCHQGVTDSTIETSSQLLNTDLFQGDIMGLERDGSPESNGLMAKNGIADDASRWPKDAKNSTVSIPYVISPAFR